MAFCFHGVRKERRVLSPFVFHACAEGGGLPPYLPTLPQEESLMLECAAGACGEKSGHGSVCEWNLCGFSVDLACVLPTIHCCPPEDRPESSRFFLLGPPVSFTECSREV